MYIIKNAWKSIIRAKSRNVLIMIVVLVIAVSACVALSIREAAETAKEETLAEMSVTATISYDRSAVMSEMMGQGGTGSGEKTAPESFDFSSLAGKSLTLDEYLSYTAAQSEGDSYYYSLTASLNASGDLSPYSSSEEDSTANTSGSTDSSKAGMGGGMQGMPSGGNFTTRGDFSITGFASYDAMMSLFGQDGTCSITEGEMFSENTSDMVCVISDELAMLNGLSVGDTITLSNPSYEDEVYTLTIVGIYTNSESSTGSSVFSRTDPANNIYMSYNTLSAITDQSKSLGNTTQDDDGNEIDAAITSEISFTYVFTSTEHYYTFEQGVYDRGLSEDYIVSSADLSSFEQSMTPLETLSTMAGWFFLIVLAIGGIILVVLNIFNIRERKYEVGVLTARGMKKGKVAAQFVCELFTITFAAILLGTVIGSCVSVPITNSLLKNQVESAQTSSENLSQNFGFGSSADMAANRGSSTGGLRGFAGHTGAVTYIDSISSATDLVVVLELVGVGLFLTLMSSLVAVVTITRYEPLKILANRS